MTLIAAIVGKFYAPSYTLTVAGSPVVTTSGRYFATTLLSHLQTAFSATSVSLSLTTGRVTLTFSGTTAITWGTASELRDHLGFTGNLSGASSYVATNRMRYAWCPSVGIAESTSGYEYETIAQYDSRTRTRIAADGSAFSQRGGRARIATLQWMHLPKEECIATDGTFGTLADLFEQVAHAGESLRLIPDRDTPAEYLDALWLGEPLGAFADYCVQSLPGWDGLRNLTLPLVML